MGDAKQTPPRTCPSDAWLRRFLRATSQPEPQLDQDFRKINGSFSTAGTRTIELALELLDRGLAYGTAGLDIFAELVSQGGLNRHGQGPLRDRFCASLTSGNNPKDADPETERKRWAPVLRWMGKVMRGRLENGRQVIFHHPCDSPLWNFL